MIDKFEKIHFLLRNNSYRDAIGLLYNSKTKQINTPFRDDLNHAWYIVGDILFKANETNQAIEAFKKAYRYRNDDVEALWAVANCYSVLCQPKNAEMWYKKALSLDANNKELLYNMGNSLFDQKKFKEAIHYYEKIDRDNNNNNNELYHIARKNINACKLRSGDEQTR